MGKITKAYLETQFTNFATRISTVFAKQTQLPTKTSDLNNDSNYVSDSNYVHTDKNYTVDDKNKVDNAVLVSVQNLTDQQKAQARANIGVEAISGPMIYKGTLGTNGTITELPASSTANNGWCYKVITNGTYQGVDAKIGDLFISDGDNSRWDLIPSGDEPDGTVTSVALIEGEGIEISGETITTSGSFTIKNKGVRSVIEGTENGTINVNINGTSANVPVKGLKANAFSDKPIPTITDTYSETGTDGISGKALASALLSYEKTSEEETENIDFSKYFSS